MQSMTGFGLGRSGDAEAGVSVQIASVNHRGCQIHLRSDLQDAALDEMARQEVRQALTRGSITVHIQLHQERVLQLDVARLSSAWRDLAELARSLGAPVPALEQVATLVHGDARQDASGRETLVRTALAQALAMLLNARRVEGSALQLQFHALAQRLHGLVRQMGAAAQERMATYHEQLLKRLRELLSDVQIGSEHLVRELAIYAERIDISEELVRLAAHGHALDGLNSSAEDQLGRRIEFLLQEIGREVNTIGAKSNDITLTALVLEAKAIVEQMREQSANIA
jgi:uncharacterized protein (TIGR00255 family)